MSLGCSLLNRAAAHCQSRLAWPLFSHTRVWPSKNHPKPTGDGLGNAVLPQLRVRNLSTRALRTSAARAHPEHPRDTCGRRCQQDLRPNRVICGHQVLKPSRFRPLVHQTELFVTVLASIHVLPHVCIVCDRRFELPSLNRPQNASERGRTCQNS